MCKRSTTARGELSGCQVSYAKYALGVQVGGQEAAVAVQGGGRGEAPHVGGCHDVLQEGAHLADAGVDRHLQGAGQGNMQSSGNRKVRGFGNERLLPKLMIQHTAACDTQVRSLICILMRCTCSTAAIAMPPWHTSGKDTVHRRV